MAAFSKVQAAQDLMKSMSPTELKQVIQYASELRNSQACRLLQLPPELRNRIYRLVIRPEDVEKHALKGNAPALLKVNRQISSEFIGLYYSPEFVTVQLYHVSSESWEHVSDAAVLQTVIRGCSGSSITTLSKWEASRVKERVSRFVKSFDDWPKDSLWMGLLSWLGDHPEERNLIVHYNVNSVEDIQEEREGKNDELECRKEAREWKEENGSGRWEVRWW
ncbi:hypothetical protein LTR37_017923 [Vermiconidia calcicola]|uniref:Uncharacterized protein n=1 Tax=Vermiconidia calcicola TaxID=1690605 RepID=A0ACC3MIQ1_9PEZI|nr:hypothetical protein LTR37_017923 [Vermiconidia calcicola]